MIRETYFHFPMEERHTYGEIFFLKNFTLQLTLRVFGLRELLLSRTEAATGDVL